MKIVILDGYSINPGDLDWKELSPLGTLYVFNKTNPNQVVARIKNADAVFTSKISLTEEILAQCQNLKFIGTLSTGYDHIDLRAAKAFGISVYNTPAYSTYSVAQHTIGLLLEICNNIGLHNQAVKQGQWYESDSFCFWKEPIIQLAGKSMGIIGYGSIGRQVGRIAEALGMTVNSCRRTESKDFEMALKSDVVTLHCPANNNTIGLVDNDFISKMKDGAILINAARGSLINEVDLAHALNSGKLLAAGIDVLTTEPPERPNPLIECTNCFVTPHIAWLAKEARQIVTMTAAKNLSDFISGRSENRII